jgi:hypothetical protein
MYLNTVPVENGAFYESFLNGTKYSTKRRFYFIFSGYMELSSPWKMLSKVGKSLYHHRFYCTIQFKQYPTKCFYMKTYTSPDGIKIKVGETAKENA